MTDAAALLLPHSTPDDLKHIAPAWLNFTRNVRLDNLVRVCVCVCPRLREWRRSCWQPHAPRSKYAMLLCETAPACPAHMHTTTHTRRAVPPPHARPPPTPAICRCQTWEGPERRKLWVAEMYGYVLAAADANISHTRAPMHAQPLAFESPGGVCVAAAAAHGSSTAWCAWCMQRRMVTEHTLASGLWRPIHTSLRARPPTCALARALAKQTWRTCCTTRTALRLATGSLTSATT